MITKPSAKSIAPFDRRQLLLGAAASMAATSLPKRALANSPHSFKHGVFDITVLSDGHMVVPATIVGVGAPQDQMREVLERTHAPVPMVWPAANIPLVRHGRDLILVDVGDGQKYQPTEGKLLGALQANGINPFAITKVVLTHAHPDHLWGMRNSAGELNYPNATYYAGASEWDFWLAPDVATKLPKDFRGIVPETQQDLGVIRSGVKLVKQGDEIVPGMRVIDTPGHTPGHFSLELEGGNGLIITADALTHEVISFEYPEWVNGFDLMSDLAIRNRRKLLDRAAKDRTKLLGFHFQYPGVGYAEVMNSKYRFVRDI
jgi:glyoxylase-like metal-dependent hydrolase (beta-lactamase superfamily II)